MGVYGGKLSDYLNIKAFHLHYLLNVENSVAISDAAKVELFQAHLSKTFYPYEDIYIPQHNTDVRN